MKVLLCSPGLLEENRALRGAASSGSIWTVKLRMEGSTRRRRKQEEPGGSIMEVMKRRLRF